MPLPREVRARSCAPRPWRTDPSALALPLPRRRGSLADSPGVRSYLANPNFQPGSRFRIRCCCGGGDGSCSLAARP